MSRDYAYIITYTTLCISTQCDMQKPFKFQAQSKQLFCTTRIFNSDPQLLTNFKMHQNESRTHYLYLYFLDIRTEEVQVSEFYLKHPQQGYDT